MLSSSKHSALVRRSLARSKCRRRSQRKLQTESLECRRLLAGDVGHNTDPNDDMHPDVPAVTVTGSKWEDINANGMRDRGEPGLPGVTIYSDLNGNGVLDDTESRVQTRRDHPDTRVDEAGTYELAGLEPGMHFIREVVPDGFEQTFPGFGPIPFDPADGGAPMDPADEFSSVHPRRIVVNLESGEPFIGEVSLTIHPVCFRPYEVDVISSDPEIEVINESGIQLNGCGGDTSTFHVVVFGHDMSNRQFELQFVDAEFGGVLASIPVHLTRAFDGAHIIDAPHGGFYEGVDFGNVRRFDAGSVHGRKWSDDNGNGVQDEGEDGLPGVRIYSDLNGNGVFDRHEPHTMTMLDDPDTEEDEGGRYWLAGLRPGRHVIREVVPHGFEQTFPGLTSAVVSSETGRFHPGVALDLDITDASVAPDTNAPAIDLELTVVWPDTCGDLISDLSVSTVVDDTILVSLHGHQVGDGCAEVISPQTETIRVPSLDLRRHDVVVTLNEDLRDGTTRATLTAVGAIELGRFGAHVVRVEPGQATEDIDFGNRPLPPGSAHGTKWLDDNGNGQWDDDEGPLAGVVIYSDLNHNGQLDADEPSTETMDDGSYWLEGLRPGFHVISEVVPDGFVQTYPGQIGDILTTSEVFVPPFGHLVKVESGHEIVDLDFGNQPVRPASVHGTKWLDENGNGVRDEGEPGLPGVTIYVDLNHNGQLDEGEPRAVTMEDFNDDLIDDNGKYWLEGLEPGHYLIREVVPDGFIQTFPQFDIIFLPSPGDPDLPVPRPPFGGVHHVWLRNGQELTGIDFGNQPIRPASVHGTKWLDENGNGVRDDNEPGLPGVTIYADLNHNGQLDEDEPHAVTMEDFNDDLIDDNGKYWLEGLEPGHYVIREVVPDGFIQTFPPNDIFPFPLPIEPGLPFPFFGGAHHVWLRNGEELTDADFGNQRIQPGSVHGTKWLDENGNGIREDDEPGLPGVTIYADLNHNAQFDDDEPHTVTMEDLNDDLIDDNGKYWLEGLNPGHYVIREVVPDGFVQTFPRSVLFDFIGIPVPFGVGAHHVWLENGQVITDLDFGNQRDEPGSVHGVKWLDENGNRLRDDGEPGLAGVTVYADLNNNGQLDADEPHTVTMEDLNDDQIDDTGKYWLDGLPSGTHVIREIVPDGFVQTFPEHLPLPVPFEPGLDGGGIWIDPYGAHVIYLEPGQVIDGLDFGNRRFEPASVHGVKWLDRNGNGQRDDDEPGLAEVIIYSDIDMDGMFSDWEPHTVTMADDPNTAANEEGHYWLEGLDPGGHVIREVIPEGFVQTFPPFEFWPGPIGPDGQPIDDFPIPIPPPNDDGGHWVWLEVGDRREEVNFGNRPHVEFAQVHGRKWVDRNGDGDRDDNEPGLPGVTIYADTNLNNRFDPDEPRAITMRDDPTTPIDETGLYWLRGIQPGLALIREVVPRGFEQTFPEILLCEATFCVGRAHMLSLEPGQVEDGLHFGNQPIDVEGGSIHGLKWNDINGNGRRDNNEPGLPGVIVYVDLNNNGVLDNNEPRTETMLDNPGTHDNEAGRYWLQNLPAGRHVVREVVPRGFEQTFPRGGGAQIVDSVSVRREPNDALGFELVAVEPVVSADGTLGTDLIFSVTWSSACGVFDSTHEIDADGRIHVQMFVMHDPRADCLQVVSELTHTVHVGALPSGEHDVRATLHELQVNQVAYVVEATFAIGGGGHHVVELRPGDVVDGVNFGNQPIERERGSIHGLKWNDLNGNGRRDDNEPGLPGVTVYVDLNNNGVLDDSEPRMDTMRDDPDTRFNESGRYWLEDLPPGRHIVREVVPRGFEQTFPSTGGARIIEAVSIKRDAERALGFELVGVEQVVSANGTLGTDLNFSVTWGNPCGLIESAHEIDDAGRIHVQMHVEDDPSAFCPQVVSDLSHTVHVGALGNGEHDLRAVLTEGHGPAAHVSHVVEARFVTGGDGHHVVILEPGDVVEGINFGNQPVDSKLGSLHGRKWADRNGNGERDPDEPGLPGVVIWLDANLNGVFDSTDPRTRTMRDDPDTERNEAGMYWFDGLEGGFYVIREVVPEGFEPTFPDPFFCRAIFCNGHGHMVTLEPGDTIDGLDFGNQPVDGEAGIIEGFKWLDRNGDGRIDDDEPGLPGVTIYLDLNNNGELDRNEPHTESRFDDPNTRINEAGHYRFDMVKPGEYHVREVIPDGFIQTFPVEGFGEVVDSISIPREPEAVLDFQLIEAGESITADGNVGIGLTYLLHHEGALCAPLFESGARVDADGRIHVEMVARPNPAALCTNEPMESTHTVAVSGVSSGRFEVRAELFEGFGRRAQLSFVNEAVVEIGRGNGGHFVVVESGQTVEGLRFGNRRDGVGPAQAIWDGEAAAGTSGEDANWEDPENWTVDGEPNSMPPEDDQSNPGARVILAPGHSQTIHVHDHHRLRSLRFMDDYHLIGEQITIADTVEVDAGVVGTLEIGLNGPVTKSGPGTLIFVGEAGDVTVADGVFGGVASLGHLQVDGSATVSPGTSPGVMNVASASFASDSTLAIEIDGVGDLEHDAIISAGVISLDGTLAVTLMDGFDDLAPGELTSITILEGSVIEGRFDNPSGWHHLDRGVFYQVSYGNTSVQVDLWQAQPGDANGDGTVDAADLDRWRENRFMFGDFANGDFNNDHLIDGSDFNVWNANRFDVAASTAAARSARYPRAAAAALSSPAISPPTYSANDLSSHALSSTEDSSTLRQRNTQPDPAAAVDQVIALDLDHALRRRSQRIALSSDGLSNRWLTGHDVDAEHSTEGDIEDWSADVDTAFSQFGLR